MTDLEDLLIQAKSRRYEECYKEEVEPDDLADVGFHFLLIPP